MSKSRQALRAAVGATVAAIVTGGLAPTSRGATRTQTFDIDPPGWLREGLPNGQVVNGDHSDFGFGTADFTGTTVNPPNGIATGSGEAGGRVATTVCASYGDSVGLLSLNDTLFISGVFNIATANQDSVFGFYNSAAIANIASTGVTASGFVPQNIGIETTGRGTMFNGQFTQNIRLHVGGVGTQTNAAQTRPNRFDGDNNALGENRVLTGNSYAFTFLYDPAGGPTANGQISVTIPGVISTQGGNTGTAALTAAIRNSGITFDRLGIIPNLVRTSGGPEIVWWDDLTYTVAGAPVASQWNQNGNGNWSTPGNWIGAVPNVAEAVANFGTVITSPHTVSVDAPQTVGSIVFNNANSYTIAGPSVITLDATGPAGIEVVNGNHTIAVPVILNDNLVANVTPVANTLTISGALTATGKNLRKEGAGTVQLENFQGVALNVTAGTVRMSAKGTPNSASGTTVVTSLQIATGAVLDLTNNSAIIDYTAPIGTLVDDVRQHLASGRLSSSSATLLRGLGYADNAVLNPVKTSFAGQTVDSTSLLIKYTYFGDTDLDGVVDVADLGTLATNWQAVGVWSAGDFDYNGTVDVNDLGLLATNWQAGVGNPLGPSLASLGLPSVTVPEPASFGMLVLAAAGLARRRVRRA
jgi:hypothetical protein